MKLNYTPVCLCGEMLRLIGKSYWHGEIKNWFLCSTCGVKAEYRCGEICLWTWTIA